MKKKLLFILIFIIYFIVPKYTYAETTLKLTNKLENIRNEVNATITYKIIPHAENEKEVENDLNEVVVDFRDVEIEDNTLTKETLIDFSNVNYKVPGTYRYGIKQQYTTDANIVLSKDMYQIYVEVTKDGDSLNVDVQPLVFDFENLEKCELEYTNNIEYTYIKIKQKVEGDYKEIDKNNYFKYKVTFYSRINNKYTVAGQDEKVEYDGKEEETVNEYVVNDTEEENYIYVYLKDGDEVTIGLNELGFNEIPRNTEYKITRIDQDKWETTFNKKNMNEFVSRTKEVENEVLIINRRDYDDAVTGLFYNIIPYILIIGISIGSYFGIKKLKLKSNKKM